MVDRSSKCFIFKNYLYIKAGHFVLLFTSTVNDISMLACRLFRQFLRVSKCFNEVNKTKILSTHRR